VKREPLPEKKRRDPFEYLACGALLGLAAYAVVDTVSCRTRELLARLGVKAR